MRDDFDRILDTGGVFLIFANSLEVEEFHWGHRRQFRFLLRETVILNNWGFLNLTSYDNYLDIKPNRGAEISLSEDIPKNAFILYLLSRHLDSASYDCTVEPRYKQEEWTSLLKNKFGSSVDEQTIGLMTAWDLHRLARSFIENGWSHENIRDLFFQSGRIAPIPKHYEFIGAIKRYIEEKSVIGIQIEASLLKRGDRIAFELPTVFEEQICESLQHENDDIEEAQAGMLVGVKTHLTKEQVKFGTCVYKVISKNPGGESRENGV